MGMMYEDLLSSSVLLKLKYDAMKGEYDRLMQMEVDARLDVEERYRVAMMRLEDVEGMAYESELVERRLRHIANKDKSNLTHRLAETEKVLAKREFDFDALSASHKALQSLHEREMASAAAERDELIVEVKELTTQVGDLSEEAEDLSDKKDRMEEKVSGIRGGVEALHNCTV